MISFRFHIVSITAVFLAIAIGVVVGSTFVDRAIVDNLEERIDSVSANLDERREEIGRLEGEIGRLEEYEDGSASYAVSGRLADRAVVVVAARGVDEGAVRGIVDLAVEAGAVAPGVLWLEPRWSLDDDGAAGELAALVGRSDGSPDVLRSRAWEAVLAELTAPSEEPTDTTTTTEVPADPATTSTTVAPTTTETSVPPAEPEALTALLGGGFLAFEAAGDDANVSQLVGRSPAVIVVTGTDAEPALGPLLAPLVGDTVGSGFATVVAEIFREPADDDVDAPRRGETALASIPEAVATQVSVVDHADGLMGQVASILAVAELQRGVGGHYGFGDGASAVVPAWTPL